jgi:two-component system chemotaxis sensor kinase CheA
VSTSSNEPLNPELLEDFYVECDEHLKSIREALSRFEPSIGKAQADATVVEELFRSFHSFKGISAIVGLRTAEELAHAAEDYLRLLNRGRATLTDRGLESLMAATQRLEQVVVAFRSGAVVPEARESIHALKEASGDDQSAAARPAVPSPALPELDEARSRGLIVWRCVFVPTRELDERGTNINVVRARLAAAGEILRSTPRVKGKGAVEFEFFLGTRDTPGDIAAWEQEGIRVELVEQGAPPAATAVHRPPDTQDLLANSNSTPFIAPSHVVRVDLNKLDDLMRIAGEMVVHRSRLDDELTQSTRRAGQVKWETLREVNAALGRSLRELRQGLMRVRMVPVAEIFARMPFVVRDLARDSKKEVRLALEGQQTELDKYLIERLKDPLLHLVRNAFSHAVETAPERLAAGKPREGVITLRALTRGDNVIIQVGDDGSGLDERAVARRARELGLPVPDPLDAAGLLQLICAPGFSTRTDADRASGRGMGMNVVYNTVRELGGSITLETAFGRGCCFTLRLPLTLTVADTLIVSTADQTCAIPQSFIVEVQHIEENNIQRVNRTEVTPYRDGLLPIYRLSTFFGLAPREVSRSVLLVLSSERGSAGLVVDRVHGQREVVVRAIRDPLVQVPGVVGATELGDGRPVLILDGAALTRGAVRPHNSTDNRGTLEPVSATATL